MKVVKVGGLLLLTAVITQGQRGFGHLGFVPQDQLGFGYSGVGPFGFGFIGVGQQGFGGMRFDGQSSVESRLLQAQFDQPSPQEGIDFTSFSRARLSQPQFFHPPSMQLMKSQENLINSHSGQQSLSPGLVAFVQQGFAHRGVGQGFGENLGVSTFDQPGVGNDAFGNPTRSGVRVAGGNNKPLEASSSTTCRQWCKGSTRGQFYCCEDNTEPLTIPIVKSGACPPRRRSCPDKPRQATTCADDGKCPGNQRCCYDSCLERHVCASPIM